MKHPFICVNYNTFDETIKYIRNVVEIDVENDAIVIVVDNSPNQDEYEKLIKFLDNESISENKAVILRRKNEGYFQALNQGILHAQNIGIKDSSFVVGNNDIIFKDDFIKELRKINFNDNIMVLSPDVITNEGSHENPHVINRIGFLRKLKYDIYYSSYFVAKILGKIKSTERRINPYDPERKEIHMGIGALYVLTPSFFKHFQTLWEDVFLYGEEAILAGQIMSVNGKILYEPNLVCYHNESSTTSKMESKGKYKIIQQSYRKYRKYL